MQIGQSKFGMQTMNQSLFNLVSKQKITPEEAYSISPDPEEIRRLLPKGFSAQF